MAARSMSGGGTSRPTMLRMAVAAIVALLLAWAGFAVTYGLALATARPGFALSWLPLGAQAKAAVAADLIARGGDLARARSLSAEALRREPVLASAAGSYGLAAAAQGDAARARAAFAYGERLSRRDIGTQLWLIEAAVARNDIPTALVHYDRALRVTSEARDRLFPILVAAAADPAVATPLRRLIAARPPWAFEYVNALAGSGTNAATIAPLVAALRPDPSIPAQREILSRALDRLVALGAPEAALALYRRSTGENAPAIVADGEFAHDGGIAPFAWTFADADGLTGFRDTIDGRTGFVLSAKAAAGARGSVARQLLVLTPGAYRLAVTAGDVASKSSGYPAVTLTCPGASEPFSRLSLPAGPVRRVTGTFTIAPSCRAARLDIVASGDIEGDGAAFWVDDVDVRPVRATGR